ncbi:MAG: pirin family protein [Pseudomonadota bacterium]
MTVRTIRQIVQGQPTSDGAGVKLKRVLGQPALDQLDPFLLLDEFRSDDPEAYIAGFPTHPHRGFETVTYMLAGHMQHRDNQGNSGDLVPGSVQWMTAGRGIEHSEMPQQEDGLMWGFQLWVNLPGARKMTDPRYQDLGPEHFPEVALESGGSVKVIAGRFAEQPGPIEAPDTQPLYLDVSLTPNERVEVPVTEGHNAMVYVFEGALSTPTVDGSLQALKTGELAVVQNGDRIALEAGSDGGRALIIAGKPLGEPVARYGPFVMNTQEEIMTAIRDYQSGQF